MISDRGGGGKEICLKRQISNKVCKVFWSARKRGIGDAIKQLESEILKIRTPGHRFILLRNHLRFFSAAVLEADVRFLRRGFLPEFG